MERAAKAPADNMPWTVRSVRALRKKRFNIAGISHALLSEKSDTGGGDKDLYRAGLRAGSVMGER